MTTTVGSLVTPPVAVDGRTVMVHCVAAYSRTLTVRAIWARLPGAGMDEAVRDVQGGVPSDANPNPAFREALRRIDSLVNGRIVKRTKRKVRSKF